MCARKDCRECKLLLALLDSLCAILATKDIVRHKCQMTGENDIAMVWPAISSGGYPIAHDVCVCVCVCVCVGVHACVIELIMHAVPQLSLV